MIQMIRVTARYSKKAAPKQIIVASPEAAEETFVNVIEPVATSAFDGDNLFYLMATTAQDLVHSLGKAKSHSYWTRTVSIVMEDVTNSCWCFKK